MIEETREPQELGQNSMVDDIKDTLRESLFVQVKERREAQINKNRAALGEILQDSSLTPDFVTEKAKSLLKKPLSSVEYHQLQNALIQSEENVDAFFKVPNAVTALVRDMSCKNPDLQLCAANCCCNLSLGNAKACTTLAKNLSAYLLIILDGCNRPMIEVALWTIGNIVTGSKAAFDILHAQDGYRHLLCVLRDCDDVILPSVAYAVLRYLHVGHHWITAEDKMDLVRIVAQKKFNNAEPEFLWLIALLSSTQESTLYFHEIMPKVLDRLFEATMDNSYSVTKMTAYIRIIGNFVAEPSGKMALVLFDYRKHSTNDFVEMLNKLLFHQYTHIRRESLWLLGNLYNHYREEIKNRTKSILPHLVNLHLAISSLP